MQNGAQHETLLLITMSLAIGCGGTADIPRSIAEASPPEAPATAKDAAAVLDLETFPFAPGADENGERSLAWQIYQTKKPPRETFAFIAKDLAAAGWTRSSSGGYESDDSVTGEFANGGFHLTASASRLGGADDPDAETTVIILNFGNLVLDKLPTPEGAKVSYASPATTMFDAVGTVDETRAELERLLVAEGWSPYGEAGDTRDYKRNAVKLKANVMAAPAKDGATVISYSAEQMSADLPAPADAGDVRYTEPPVELRLVFRGTADEADAWYRETLGKLGWKPTTDTPVEEDNESWVIYRNDAKEMAQTKFREYDGRTDVLVEYTSAKGVEEMDRRFEEYKKKMEAERTKEQ